MPDPRGWPAPRQPRRAIQPGEGRPTPNRGRIWPRRWAWWIPNSSKTFGGWTYAGGGGRESNWTYIGPAAAPDGLPVD
jgi:hypothetical protein